LPLSAYTPSVTGYLDRLLEFDSWANRGLLEFLATQPPEVLDLTTGGVYGTIRETFEHLLTSELGYQRRLAGLPRYDLEARPERPSLAELRTLADEAAASLAALAERVPEPATMLVTGDGLRAAATIVTQLVMHGVEHRGHVGTILGANGIEPPDLDSWAHGIFAHGDAWPSDWGPEPSDRATMLFIRPT
jgi:uncharacterized damage-inducible protein DinB